MCNYYAYAALQVASSYQQYKAEKSYANQVNQNTYAAAKRTREEAIYKDISLQKKKGVEYDKSAAEKFKISLAAKKAKGKAKVLLFERGLGGNVFTTLIGDIDRNEGRAFNNTDMNYENAVYSIEDQRLAYNRQFTNQILNMPLRSYAPFGTYLLSAAANTTGAYLMTQAPSTPSSGFDNSYQKSFDWEADK